MILEETSSMYQIHICLQGFGQQNKRKGLLIPNTKIKPGLKAKLLFIFIVCSDKIKNRVMLSGKSNENGEKTIIGQTLKPKKNNFARAAHFFVHFFAVVLHDFNVKLPETRLVTRSLEEMSSVFLFTFFSLPLIFIFLLWPLAFLIFPQPLQNFHVVFSTKFDSFVFISRSGSLSLVFSLSFPGL